MSKQAGLTERDALKLFQKGTLAFSRAERYGVRIDIEYCEKEIERLDKEIQESIKKLNASKFIRAWRHRFGSKFNLNSNWQLSFYLYDVRKIKPTKLTSSGKGSTDEETLKSLNIPELDELLRIRKLTKTRDTYLKGFLREQVHGILHPSINLNLVWTFRSSMSDPNIQNIPIRDEEMMNICRRAIIPRSGNQIAEVDFSGIEVKVAACYHKDKNMLKYIKEPESDMHKDMAMQIFKLSKFKKNSNYKKLRQAAKNSFVFPQFYGDYYKHCAQGLASWGELPVQEKWKPGQGVPLSKGTHLVDHLMKNNIRTYSQFEEHIRKIEQHFWEKRFPDYARWKEEWWRAYQKRGWFQTLTGFVCRDPMRKNEAINAPIQGSAFHCLLWSFIRIDEISKKEKWKSRLVSQTHDSMLFDMVPQEKDYVLDVVRRVCCEELPATWDWIIVPMDVEVDICDIDRPWAEKRAL